MAFSITIRRIGTPWSETGCCEVPWRWVFICSVCMATRYSWLWERVYSCLHAWVYAAFTAFGNFPLLSAKSRMWFVYMWRLVKSQSLLKSIGLCRGENKPRCIKQRSETTILIQKGCVEETLLSFILLWLVNFTSMTLQLLNHLFSQLCHSHPQGWKKKTKSLHFKTKFLFLMLNLCF